MSTDQYARLLAIQALSDAGTATTGADSLAELRAMLIVRGFAFYDRALWSWVTGDGSSLVDNVDVVASDYAAATIGTWRRIRLQDCNTRVGLVLSGQTNSPWRPKGQFAFTNDPSIVDPLIENHAILTQVNYHAWEESALESIGYMSNGGFAQQYAQYIRWWRSINNPATKEGIWGLHMPRAGQDNSPINVLGRNTVILCAGDVTGKPWEWDPPENFLWVYTKAKVGTSIHIGPNLWDPDVASGVRFSVEGGFQVGLVNGAATAMEKVLWGGYSSGGDTAFIQGYNTTLGAFTKLQIGGTEITIGAPGLGQKIGLFGHAAGIQPTITGNLTAATLSDVTTVLGNLLTGLASYGAVVKATT